MTENTHTKAFDKKIGGTIEVHVHIRPLSACGVHSHYRIRSLKEVGYAPCLPDGRYALSMIIFYDRPLTGK